MFDEELTKPIFKRRRIFVDPPRLINDDRNLHRCWQRLHPQKCENRFDRVGPLLAEVGPPKICFVGSSHVHHLKNIVSAGKLPERSLNFLAKSKFVGCGGLKFWSSPKKLNGNGSSIHQIWELMAQI